jgi:hypothetical protein
MKKQLNEEVSRIKGMMKSIVNEDFETNLNEGRWDSPEEIERVNKFNETNKGITLVLQYIEKLYGSQEINRESFHKSHRAILNVLKEYHNDINNREEKEENNI